MVFIFFFVCLLNTGYNSIQSEETGDQSVEHKRLLLNDPQAMNDRLIDLERKLQAVSGTLQAVNGKVASLESENIMLKSTMAANTKTTNSKIETIKGQLANVGVFYRLIVQSIHIFLFLVAPVLLIFLDFCVLLFVLYYFLCSVSCVPNVACVSVLPILNCSFGFL
jgi:hypothetical protein